MALGRIARTRIVFGATVGLAVVTAFAVVSVRAPALAGERRVDAAIVIDTAPAADVIVERAFTVPPGTARIEVDVAGPESDTGYPSDFGVRGPAGIRGWTTAHRAHVHIDAASASYGYLPGPIEPGDWHVMLGPRAEARDALRVTVRLSDRLDNARPTLRAGGGWFAGDVHVHSGHSDGYHVDPRGHDTPVSVREIATAAAARGLDFVAITDHNTISHWVDVDRTQADTPGLLLLHGREITTPRGHLNALGERRFSDFRLGPGRPMSQLLRELGRNDVFRSINHPWLAIDQWCDGCAWADRDATTIGNADGVEILNGSSPDDPDLPGWRLWAEWQNRGRRLTAVGGSDAHDLLPGGASLGSPSTVVWASELSEPAIVAGLRSGLAFVRASPDPHLAIDLTASASGKTASMGGSIAPGRATLAVRVRGAAGMRCEWMRRGALVRHDVVGPNDSTLTLTIDGLRDDWFAVIVRRGRTPVLMTNAIYVTSSPPHASSYVPAR